MKNVIKLLSILFLVSGLVFVSCKKKEINVASVSLDKPSLELEVGDVVVLNATVLPDNAEDKTITWTSSKPTVASVTDGGVVKAESAGECEITVTTKDGDKTASCKVKVILKMKDSFMESVNWDTCQFRWKITVWPAHNDGYAFKVDSSEFANPNFYKAFGWRELGDSSDIYLQFVLKNISDTTIPAGTPYKFVLTRNGKEVTEVRQHDGTLKPVGTEGKLENDIEPGGRYIFHKEDPFYVNSKTDTIGQNKIRIELKQLGKKESYPSKAREITYKIKKT